MANPYLSGTANHRLMNRHQVSNTKKQANWFHSIIAGAAMLAISSLGVVLVFDWYLFSVIDGLSASLRPIAGALRHANGDATKNAGNASDPRERREQPRTKDAIANSSSFGSSTTAKAITDKSNQPRDGDQAGSLFVPVRSADLKTPAN
jgi:hypothetical protein